MKKIISAVLTAAIALTAAASLSACSKSDSLTIAVPNDTTNEARALLLLEQLEYIKLKDGADTATIQDIQDNPYNLPLEKWKRRNYRMSSKTWITRLLTPITR